MEEQFTDPPESQSETSFDLRAGTSDQPNSDPTSRAASTLPVVNIGSENIIATRGQKMAENLHSDQKSIEFLTALKELVDHFPEKVETLYLEPVLIFNKDTGLYDMDLHACTEPQIRIISYLMEQNDIHQVIGMDQESFESFYQIQMKKYKPAVKKKTGLKKSAPVTKKNQAKQAEAGEELVDPDQTPQDKVVETHDHDT